MAACGSPDAVSQSSNSSDSRNVYAQSFDVVWSTIDDRFYDRDLKGVDWKQSRERFEPIITNARDDDEFYEQINLMLFELGVSHNGVVPIDDVKQLGEATVFGEGTVGLDVRIVGEKLIAVRVDSESSAHKAGIRPGDQILSVNGRSLTDFKTETLAFRTPPFHLRNDRYMVLNEIYWELLGPLTEDVRIEFTSGAEGESNVILHRELRSTSVVFEEGLPPTYVTSTYHMLDENIGYLRFNTFHPELLDEISAALDLFAEADAIIIDLRGNPGGAFGVRHQLASRFVVERSLIWRYRGSDGIDEIFLEPSDQPYTGKLVILVDGQSASSSEEFAGGLQGMGRATIVGERTPGRDLVADISVLPVGAYFVFPIAETQTADGTVLEYRGVIPDIEVTYAVDALAEGRDVQLDAAIELL